MGEWCQCRWGMRTMVWCTHPRLCCHSGLRGQGLGTLAMRPKHVCGRPCDGGRWPNRVLPGSWLRSPARSEWEEGPGCPFKLKCSARWSCRKVRLVCAGSDGCVGLPSTVVFGCKPGGQPCRRLSCLSNEYRFQALKVFQWCRHTVFLRRHSPCFVGSLRRYQGLQARREARGVSASLSQGAPSLLTESHA
jgi:hypothetical protein